MNWTILPLASINYNKMHSFNTKLPVHFSKCDAFHVVQGNINSVDWIKWNMNPMHSIVRKYFEIHVWQPWNRWNPFHFYAWNYKLTFIICPLEYNSVVESKIYPIIWAIDFIMFFFRIIRFGIKFEIKSLQCYAIVILNSYKKKDEGVLCYYNGNL